MSAVDRCIEGDVGPYRLTLTTTPVTGSMHFIILLSTAGDESPVSDPELTMRGVFIDGEGLEVGPVAGYATMEGPLWFAADLPVETEGLWEFTLTVDAPLGREEVTFPVAVQGPGGVSLTLIALIVVALALFGFTLGNRMFGRRRRRSRRSAGLQVRSEATMKRMIGPAVMLAVAIALVGGDGSVWQSGNLKSMYSTLNCRAASWSTAALPGRSTKTTRSR